MNGTDNYYLDYQRAIEELCQAERERDALRLRVEQLEQALRSVLREYFICPTECCGGSEDGKPYIIALDGDHHKASCVIAQAERMVGKEKVEEK